MTVGFSPRKEMPYHEVVDHLMGCTGLENMFDKSAFTGQKSTIVADPSIGSKGSMKVGVDMNGPTH